jgi:hypothetical protein
VSLIRDRQSLPAGTFVGHVTGIGAGQTETPGLRIFLHNMADADFIFLPQSHLSFSAIYTLVISSGATKRDLDFGCDPQTASGHNLGTIVAIQYEFP